MEGEREQANSAESWGETCLFTFGSVRLTYVSLLTLATRPEGQYTEQNGQTQGRMKLLESFQNSRPAGHIRTLWSNTQKRQQYQAYSSKNVSM